MARAATRSTGGSSMNPLVRIENIKFAYRVRKGHSSGNPPLLDGFSLNILKGEWVGLTGPSGCGKSTLGRIIAGHLRPLNGKIWINGQDLTKKPGRHVIMLQQES